MKILVIPDLHASTHWKKAIPLVDQYDKVVVLGDEFDTWENKWPSQMNNAKALIKFKQQYPDKVCLCWSNHATSYYLDERCSGHQSIYAIDIKEFYDTHKDLFDVCFIFDKYLFVHAGVSYKWMRAATIKKVEEINQLFKERPNFFRWVGPNGYGDNYGEGPLWIRPGALIRTAVKGYTQVVGHTENKDHPKEYVTDTHEKIIVIDTNQHDKLTEIDTETDEWKVI